MIAVASHLASVAPQNEGDIDAGEKCKHYTSKYRKMATEILYENNGYDTSAMGTNAMNYSITIKKNWNDAHNNKQLTMRNKYTNDDVDLDDCAHICR